MLYSHGCCVLDTHRRESESANIPELRSRTSLKKPMKASSRAELSNSFAVHFSLFFLPKAADTCKCSMPDSGANTTLLGCPGGSLMAWITATDSSSPLFPVSVGSLERRLTGCDISAPHCRKVSQSVRSEGRRALMVCLCLYIDSQHNSRL